MYSPQHLKYSDWTRWDYRGCIWDIDSFFEICFIDYLSMLYVIKGSYCLSVLVPLPTSWPWLTFACCLTLIVRCQHLITVVTWPRTPAEDIILSPAEGIIRTITKLCDRLKWSSLLWKPLHPNKRVFSSEGRHNEILHYGKVGSVFLMEDIVSLFTKWEVFS